GDRTRRGGPARPAHSRAGAGGGGRRDLGRAAAQRGRGGDPGPPVCFPEPAPEPGQPAVQLPLPPRRGDRKSTRLNSSHVKISYAVFCLKKKKRHNPNTGRNYREREGKRL